VNGTLKKIALVMLAIVLLVGASFVQHSLNRDRQRLGLTRVEPLENAPPMLAFTTVALGGFRGLISNLLWIRATELQDDDKYFEATQLASWITKLEPHFAQVWVHQAWNMAYNISVKFKDYSDRWRWVKRGIELLRDEGLRYNPNDVLMYRELGWFYQHKMGANLDDASMYYKQEWANEMAEVFGKLKEPDFESLINPKTDDEKRRAQTLHDKYKLDPAFMKELNDRYGPLEWRLPEAHAIYWAALGLRKAQENPSKINPDDLIQLRRVIYQSMQLSFQRGRLEANPYEKLFEFGPNLDIIPKTVAAYEEAMTDDPKNRDVIERAHRNLLRQAVYFLYVNNRVRDAAYWYKYLGEKYPNKPVIDGTQLMATNTTLDQYSVAFIQEDVNDMSKDRVQNAIEGYLTRAYYSLVLGDDERFTGHRLMAQKIWDNYNRQIPAERTEPLAIPPIDQLSRIIVNRLLDPETGFPPEMRAILRTKLRLPAEEAPLPVKPASTNSVSTNSVSAAH
jgi:hypothetical protein